MKKNIKFYIFFSVGFYLVWKLFFSPPAIEVPSAREIDSINNELTETQNKLNECNWAAQKGEKKCTPEEMVNLHNKIRQFPSEYPNR